MFNDVSVMVQTWCNDHEAVHLVAEEPNVELENCRLLAIDLDIPGDGTLMVFKSDVSTYRRLLLFRIVFGMTIAAPTICRASLRIRVMSVPTTHVYQITHCSWMCCWKLGRLRSLRARRRIFFSSSVSFFCPISFNLAAAISKHEGQQRG